MLRGKQFQLDKDTIALLLADGKRELFHIPFDSTLTVLSEGAEKDGTVVALWQDRLVQMFLVDIEQRGTLLADETSLLSATA